MIQTKFQATITDRQTKTTSKGTEFETIRLTYEGESFGKPITTVVEATVPQSLRETLPDVGSEGTASLVMSSREYNGRLYYDFRITHFDATKVVTNDSAVEEVDQALADVGDEVPF